MVRLLTTDRPGELVVSYAWYEAHLPSWCYWIVPGTCLD